MATQPVAVVCVGMAGSGKTTFMQRINNYLHVQKTKPYVLNLDPAVLKVPFQPNIDIRDSINYKEVMKQYNLGPNGGILTSLNLFATKIDQIINLLEKRANPAPPVSSSDNISTTPTAVQTPPKHILVDTPGQIEVFVWSASGSILLESLASSFPTVIAYIIDTPRTASTSTFMSNMLYACSILYKTKLPMILVFNKTDVQDAEFAREWMTDFEKFQDALRAEEDKGVFGGEGSGQGGSGYMSSLLNSMSLMLEEFYAHLSMVGVSSMSGDGIAEFFEKVEEKRQEFEQDYKPELERRRKERQAESKDKKDKDLTRFMEDMSVEAAGNKNRTGGGHDADVDDDDEDEDEEEADDEDNQLDADDYPDAERQDPEISLRKRYEAALKAGTIDDTDDATQNAMMRGMRMS